MIHAVIGGGAAGIFAALRCKSQHPDAQVVVFEKTNQLLAKVRISGGGRCNVTHACFDPKQLVQNYPRGAKELLGPFHSFQPKDTIAWFEARGVTLKTEADGRMFPITDSSQTIIDCLLAEADKIGVEIRKQAKIESVVKVEGGFLIDQMRVDRLILATGSSSFGYQVAKSFGHSIVEPVPSLFTFNVPTSNLLDLAGISVPHAVLTIKETGHRQEGPLLITHWGFSGPAALKLSAWAARELHDLDYKATLVIQWTDTESFLERKGYPAIPRNLLVRLGINPAVPMRTLSNKVLSQMGEKLSADAYAVEGKTTYKQEFVTAGGIHLKEVDFKTMQSRITPGLFFAGEILNIDGITGGFNFQNAWTTGWLAGNAS